jgi:site-specific DNA recombinase
MKRVWCLYRVSTKQQVNTDDDIPMQKIACHNYAKLKGDWEITNELFEKGISGWSKSADERDALNTIRAAAVNKEFDILLVFMFDRLGRRDDETPFVINFLHQNGVDVWSVQEGQRKLDSHVDKLINYISSWQSSGESIKTSLRVRESKKQLSEKNLFQGGKAPYGYKIVDTDQPHWKDVDRKIKELVPDEDEKIVVEMIFQLYTAKHMGYRKICEYLNSNGYRTRDGIEFGVSTVQRILSNPIFIGLKRYKSFDGKDGDTQPYNEKLRIVSDEIFKKAEDIKNKRKNLLSEQDKSGIPLAGKLMFSGLAYCGYCKNKLSANYLYREQKYPKDGTKTYTNIIYRYRCPMNKGKTSSGHEKNIWGSKRLDKKAIDEIKFIISNLNIEKFIEKSIGNKSKLIKSKENILTGLKKEMENLAKKLDKLNQEIANSLIGESTFSPEQLSSAINGINQQLKDKKELEETLEIEVEDLKYNHSEILNLAEELVNWGDKFDKADDDLKKAMLSRVLDRIYFYKDHADFDFNYYVKQLIAEVQGEIVFE